MAALIDPTRPSPNDDPHDDVVAVPGGVPVVMWRAAPGTEGLSPQLAKSLLEAHTRRGDVVLDVDDDVAFSAAAAQTARHHHALGGVHHLAALGDATGYIDLVLLRWPQLADPRWLLVACRTLLRHDTGVLVVTIPSQQRITHLTTLATAAHTVGLRQVGHIAAVDPDTAPASRSGPRTADAAPPGSGDAAADHPGGHTRSDATAAAQVTPHTDLLIFATEDGHDD